MPRGRYVKTAQTLQFWGREIIPPSTFARPLHVSSTKEDPDQCPVACLRGLSISAGRPSCWRIYVFQYERVRDGLSR